MWGEDDVGHELLISAVCRNRRYFEVAGGEPFSLFSGKNRH